MRTPGTGKTIDELLEEIQRRGAGGDRVTVSYDPRTGYPTEAYFDGGQEGDGWKIVAFERL